MRILLFENNPKLASQWKAGLEHYGYAIHDVTSIEGALSLFNSQSLDLILLSLFFAEQLRSTLNEKMLKKVKQLPMIITHPGDTPETLHRCVLKHLDSRRETPPIRTHRSLTLEPTTRNILKDGHYIDNGRYEYAVMDKLIRCAGQVVLTEQLVQFVYGTDDQKHRDALFVHICTLRKKLGKQAIYTLGKEGYTLGEID